MKHKTDQQPNWNRLEHEPDQNTPKHAQTELNTKNKKLNRQFIILRSKDQIRLTSVHKEKGDNT